MSSKKTGFITLFSQRLRKARKDAGLSREQVAVYARVSLSAYRNWEQGLNEPQISATISLSKVLDVPLEWLLLGENRRVIQEIDGMPTLPVLGDIGCGFEGRLNDIPVDAPREPVSRKVLDLGGRYYIEAVGDSMTGAGISEGDLVAIRPDAPEAESLDGGAIYAILVSEGQDCRGVLLKRLIEAGGEIWAVPDMPDPAPRRLADLGTEVKVFGRVVAILKYLE